MLLLVRCPTLLSLCSEPKQLITATHGLVIPLKALKSFRVVARNVAQAWTSMVGCESFGE